MSEMNDRPAPRKRKTQKPSPIALLTIPVVVLSLVVSLSSCSGSKEPADSAAQQRIETLESENQALKQQLEELNEKSIKLSNRVLELMTQQKLTAEDIALIQTQLDIIESYADRLPDEAQKALNNIIEYLNSK